jgi:hypothetical protein
MISLLMFPAIPGLSLPLSLRLQGPKWRHIDAPVGAWQDRVGADEEAPGRRVLQCRCPF